MRFSPGIAILLQCQVVQMTRSGRLAPRRSTIVTIPRIDRVLPMAAALSFVAIFAVSTARAIPIGQSGERARTQSSSSLTRAGSGGARTPQSSEANSSTNNYTNEIAELHQARSLLESANHDYSGHKAAAAKLVSAAIESLHSHNHHNGSGSSHAAHGSNGSQGQKGGASTRAGSGAQGNGGTVQSGPNMQSAGGAGLQSLASQSLGTLGSGVGSTGRLGTLGNSGSGSSSLGSQTNSTASGNNESNPGGTGQTQRTSNNPGGAMPQATSDAQLHKAMAQIQAVESQIGGGSHRAAHAAGLLQKAVQELQAALSIK
jgi:hypothetical protein